MTDISRRRFLAGSAALASAAAIAGSALADDSDNTKPGTPLGTDLVTLGNTGLKISRLGIGTGTHGGNDQLAMGSEGFTRMIRHALDRGITYLDTADQYNTHVFLRLALQGVPRDRYFIQTKTRAKSAETVRADVDRYLRVLRCRHIDSLLMHCLQSADWATEMEPVMAEMLKLKEEGKIRSVGISSHGMPPLAASPAVDWCQVQLIRLNPYGAKMDGTPEEVVPVVEQLAKSGRGLLGMKVFGEGTLGSAEKRYESIKWQLKLGLIDAFTIGFISTQQIDEVLEMIERAGKELAG